MDPTLPQKGRSKPHHRRPTDIHPKVLYGGGAALIVAGLLQVVEQNTGVHAPPGTDEYVVALVASVVGWLKSGDGG